ncbi:MAG: hypothetical protein SNG14_07620 [Rikenellaceae bacterium]
MFTSTPQSFNSLYESQIFKFEGTYIEDLTFEVKEASTGDILGVKKFYQTSTAELNISPIVRPFVIPSPHVSETGFVEDALQGAISLYVSKQATSFSSEVDSEAVQFVLSRSVESTVGVVSDFSNSRTIANGEYDTLAIRCSADGGARVAVKQYLYDEATSEISSTAASTVEFDVIDTAGNGLAIFNFKAEPIGTLADSGTEVASYDLVIYNKTLVGSGSDAFYATGMVETINYQVIDAPANPTRLAWVSSRGVIENYTMPYIASEALQRTGERVYTLQSALEEYEVRNILAEMVSSEAVWVYNSADEKYSEVKIIDDEIELSPEEDLAVVKIKISLCD